MRTSHSALNPAVKLYDSDGKLLDEQSFPIIVKDADGNTRVTIDGSGVSLFDANGNQVSQLGFGGGLSIRATALPDVPLFDLGPSGIVMGAFQVDPFGNINFNSGYLTGVPDPVAPADVASKGYVDAHAANFGNFSIDDVTPTPYGFSIDEALVISNTLSDGKLYLGVTGVAVFEGHEVFFGFASRSGGTSENMGMYVNNRALYFWDGLLQESAFFVKGDTGQTIVCGPGLGYSPAYDDGTGAILQVNGDASASGSYWASGTQGGSGFSVLDADGVTTHAIVGGLVMP